MSKIEHDRPRHVALSLAGPAIARRDLQVALERAWTGPGPAPRVTRFDFPHAFVRVRHDQLEALRRALTKPVESLRVTSLATSGTLRGLSAMTGLLPRRD